jgi:hypothetical protein
MCIELALLKITFSDVSGDASILAQMVVYANCCQLSTPRSLLFEKVISKQVLHSHFSNRLDPPNDVFLLGAKTFHSN